MGGAPPMTDTPLERASALLAQAEQLDRSGKHREAKDAYVKGAEQIALALKKSTNERLKPRLRERLQEVIGRAEQLQEQIASSAGPARALSRPLAETPAPASASNAAPRAEDAAATDALMESLRGTIICERPQLPWDQVAGVDYAKRMLRDATELPTQFPHLFRQGSLQPCKGILLYGPPGTGKTYLAKAVASNSPAECTFLSISSADLVSKWVGESAKLVKTLFTLARRLAPSVVFVDEIDALCSERAAAGPGKSEASAQLLAEFLTQMDGCGPSTEGTLILAATNFPWALDRAILSRFQKKIHIALPSQEHRLEQLRIGLRASRSCLTDTELSAIAARTERFSSRDLATLVQAAMSECLEEFKSASKWRRFVPHPFDKELDCAYEPVSRTGKEQGQTVQIVSASLQQLAEDPAARARTVLPAVERRHFDQALKRCKASVSKEDVVKFDAWTEHYGTSA